MFTKKFIRKSKRVKYGVIVESLGENKYRINDILYARNGKDFVSTGTDFKKNHCIYIVAKTFGVENKLLFNNKRVQTCEIGALTCYEISSDTIIPASLIDEAVEEIQKLSYVKLIR